MKGTFMLNKIRNILGKIIVMMDSLTSPTPITRTADAQAEIDQRTKNLELYQFVNCPFCVKVRRGMKRWALKIPLVDASQEPFRSELETQGGMLQVPCLKIKKGDGTIQWMYESSDILQYLEQNFGQ